MPKSTKSENTKFVFSDKNFNSQRGPRKAFEQYEQENVDTTIKVYYEK